MSRIIINTDASYSQEHDVGGYAFHIRGENFVTSKSGFLGSDIGGPAQAELLCIGLAIASLLSQKDLKKTSTLILFTDCVPAINQINSPTIMEAVEVARLWGNLIKRLSPVNIEIRHVRAHTAYKSDKAFINNLLDRDAKKWMRKALSIKINELENSHLCKFA